MIDTIEFVLHSVNDKIIDLSPGAQSAQKYNSDFNRLLYERLCEYKGVYVERTVKFLHDKLMINPDDAQFLSKAVHKAGWVMREAQLIDSRNKQEFFYPRIRGNIFTPSHDYHTQFSISENTNSITFSLSIPKYFYNHNVAQWVPNFHSKRFQNAPWHLCTFGGQLKYLRERLLEFIATFFNDLSNTLKLYIFDFNIQNIEIKRLDLCYNQHFPSNAFVMDFLTSQRKFKNSRIKKNTIIDQDYEHAFNYRHSTDGFFFKIYVKGEEFKTHDFGRLNKENKEFIEQNKNDLYPKLNDVFRKHFPETFKHAEKSKKFENHDLMFQYYENYSKAGDKIDFCDEFEKFLPFKTAFLLRESMKILRYEMSFTRKYMSTLYKRELFRKNCSEWKKMKRSYELIKRYDLSLSRDSREKADNFKRKYRLTAKDRQNYEVYDNSLHKKHNFFIALIPDLVSHEKTFHDAKLYQSFQKYKIKERNEASLNDDLFKLLYKKFQEEIQFYQVKELQQTKSILEAIDDYNKKADERKQLYISQFSQASFDCLTHTEKRKRQFSKLNKTRIKIVLDKMDKGEALKDICDNMGMSNSSYHTLRKDLEVFGVFKNTIKHKFDYSRIKWDFKPYYDLFVIDKRYNTKIFHDPQMIGFDTVRNY